MSKPKKDPTFSDLQARASALRAAEMVNELRRPRRGWEVHDEGPAEVFITRGWENPYGLVLFVSTAEEADHEGEFYWSVGWFGSDEDMAFGHAPTAGRAAADAMEFARLVLPKMMDWAARELKILNGWVRAEVMSPPPDKEGS